MKHITLVAALAFVLPTTAQVGDGSFEAGPGGGAWTEASVNFGTPLCDAATCGTCGGPCVARSGTWYAWFGGAGGVTETGSVEQSAMVPTGSDVRLLMWVKVALANAVAADRVDVSVDGTVVGTVSVSDSVAYADYSLLNIDMNAYAGGSHTIRIEGFQTTADVSNILVDDVELLADGATVGLFENEDLPGIMVYPNPANNVINLSFNALEGSAVVKVTDMTGKVVTSTGINEVNRKVFTYDATDLNNGVYFVTVDMGTTSYVERVVITR